MKKITLTLLANFLIVPMSFALSITNSYTGRDYITVYISVPTSDKNDVKVMKVDLFKGETFKTDSDISTPQPLKVNFSETPAFNAPVMDVPECKLVITNLNANNAIPDPCQVLLPPKQQ